jgi:hypothetical protein
MSGKK